MLQLPSRCVVTDLREHHPGVPLCAIRREARYQAILGDLRSCSGLQRALRLSAAVVLAGAVAM